MRQDPLTNHVTVAWCLSCGRLRTWPALEAERVEVLRLRARCTCGRRNVAAAVVHANALGGIHFQGWELRVIAKAVEEAVQREQSAADEAHASRHNQLWRQHHDAAAVLRRLHQHLTAAALQRDVELAHAMGIDKKPEGPPPQ